MRYKVAATHPTSTSVPFLSSCTETQQHVTLTRAGVACNSSAGYSVSRCSSRLLYFVHLLISTSRTYSKNNTRTSAPSPS